ncbi:hypothetical protein E8E13_011029 [Curvularia kusanoi]|uniref:Uncharacterized protein n=1 Tax=Curvularia kusanoi TaxID=90978 RepID=A0A9P4TH30_CURKU|nr:hypothetical protein E8E13_011029 [Curvularia kusanoi]
MAPPPASSAAPPALSATPPALSAAPATSVVTASRISSTTEVATSIVTVTTSASRAGEISTEIIITPIVTREEPAATGIATSGGIFILDSLPVSCSSRWVLYISSGSTVITSGNYAGTMPTGSVSSGYWQDCYPSAPKDPQYSPAICTGQTSVITIKSSVEGTGSTAATVWSGICCPSGMSYIGRCERAFTTPFTALSPMQILVTTSAASGAWASSTIGWETITANKTIRSKTVLSSGTLFAEPVTVLWKSSDLSNFPTAYATALAAEMGFNLSPELPDYTATDSPSTVSAGAKYGIAVGALFGSIFLFSLIVYLVYLCVRKHRKARQGYLPEGIG